MLTAHIKPNQQQCCNPSGDSPTWHQQFDSSGGRASPLRAHRRAVCYRTLNIMGRVPIFNGAMLADFAISTSYNTRRCNLQMKTAVGNHVSSSALQTS